MHTTKSFCIKGIIHDCITTDIFIHIHPFHLLPSNFTHFHPFPSIFIHLHQFAFIYIHFLQFVSTFNHLCPNESICAPCVPMRLDQGELDPRAQLSTFRGATVRPWCPFYQEPMYPTTSDCIHLRPQASIFWDTFCYLRPKCMI